MEGRTAAWMPYAVELRREVIAAACHYGDREAAAMISGGEEKGAWYEHRVLADRLYGAPAGGRPAELPGGADAGAGRRQGLAR